MNAASDRTIGSPEALFDVVGFSAWMRQSERYTPPVQSHPSATTEGGQS